MFELLDTRPAVNVPETEYRRLLGYPPGHAPGGRAIELSAWARRAFEEIGQPWFYVREVALEAEPHRLAIDGVEFPSERLGALLAGAGARRVLLMAVSAGPGLERRTAQLWDEGKPDEYFFLEIFGSAVVEHLVASTNGRLCAWAAQEGWDTLPHYSPGYTGWDVADQPRLFGVLARGRPAGFPQPLEVLASGMLKPKKSLLAVVGLAPAVPGRAPRAAAAPCESCAFTPCAYRRRPYTRAPGRIETVPEPAFRPAPTSEGDGFPLTRSAAYTVNPRALQKWARERVRLETSPDGTVSASFRFDGTTCSNQGRPLAFDYFVRLSAAADGFRLLESDCRAAPGDEGHRFMCAYLSDSAGLMAAIGAEKPLLGRPLDEVLGWLRVAAPSGCYCQPEYRTHKWGLALEAIHLALVTAHTQPESVAP